MNCPNCGTQTLSDQQYCRSCGADLIGDPPPRFNMRAWGLIALIFMFGGLLISMGGKLWGEKLVLFTGLIITFVGMFSIAAFGMIRQTRPRRRKPAPTPQSKQPEILAADTTNKLLPIGDNDFIPSVVENTTELLKTPAARDRS